MKKIFALLLLMTLSFSSCEKDDICTDETTPRLIIEFYDISSPADLKNVVNLKVGALNPGGTDPDFIVFNSALPTTDASRYLFNGNKLELPLRIDGTTTKYRLILNSTGITPNVDFLQFDYTTQNIFVSRACGYKTIFNLNSFNGVTLTDSLPPDTLWIQDINTVTTSITTENETHIKIYF